MKKSLILLVFVCFTRFTSAQNTAVETSTFGIQTGFLGIWLHHEGKLSDEFALRSEFGLDAGVFSENFEDGSLFIFVPALTLEPRWYYNLDKRTSKSRRTDGNSGNFISVKTTYHPDITLGNVDDDLNFISDISIIPTWGIRRNVGRHITYEAGIGIGYVRFLEELSGSILKKNDVAVNLHLRIGYRF